MKAFAEESFVPGTPMPECRGIKGLRQLLTTSGGASLGTPSTAGSLLAASSDAFGLLQQTRGFQEEVVPEEAAPEEAPMPRPEAGSISAWRLGSQIGAGSFGSVYKAQDLHSGAIFAVKRARGDPNEVDQSHVDSLKVEIGIFSTLSHPHIVSYLGWDFKDRHLNVFLEFVPGGSMSSILSTFGALAGNLLLGASKDCLEGLHYLHSRQTAVMHRDLKCANLLVDLSFRVKLTDFGCSKMSSSSKSFSTVGSLPWMAPEVLQSNGYGRKADIWSFGCTLIEMATAEKPWGSEVFSNNSCYAMRIIADSEELPSVPGYVPEWCRALVQSCCQREVQARPSTRVLRLRLPGSVEA